jgi:hypothetical protein
VAAAFYFAGQIRMMNSSGSSTAFVVEGKCYCRQFLLNDVHIFSSRPGTIGVGKSVTLMALKQLMPAWDVRVEPIKGWTDFPDGTGSSVNLLEDYYREGTETTFRKLQVIELMLPLPPVSNDVYCFTVCCNQLSGATLPGASGANTGSPRGL